MKIEEVLARRSDLSTFLVHLCRNKDDVTAPKRLEAAPERLRAILREGCIRAMTPMGHAWRRLEDVEDAGINYDSQKAVSFTETPLEHTSLLFEDIEGRDCQFECYGIAITKKQARKNGVNPVWYLDATPGHNWLTRPVAALVEAAIQDAQSAEAPKPFEESAICRLAPFMDHMGTWENSQKEFWWEREWRHASDFPLYPHHYIVLAPEDEFDELRGQVGANLDPGVREWLAERPDPAFVDPHWSLEQIIARLARFAPEDVGPF